MFRLQRSTICRPLCVAAVAFLVALAASTACATVTITEDFGSDPGWTGSNNTGYGTNNYGFSNTNNNGLGAGEAGGSVMARTKDIWTHYADTTLGGTLGLSDAMTASGRLIVNLNQGALFDGGFEVGFFNTADTTMGTGNVVGTRHQGMVMEVMDGGDSNFRFRVRYGDAIGDWLTPFLGQTYDFAMTYNPTGGDSTHGLLSATLTRIETGLVLGTSSVTNGNGESWALNAFGISTINLAADVAGPNFFMDHLAYSAVPEPSALALLTGGLVGLLAYAWRKRK